MPKFMRRSTTRNAPLSDRMASVFENGYGDEGPVAKGCCLALMLLPLLFIVTPVVALLLWIGHIL